MGSAERSTERIRGDEVREVGMCVKDSDTDCKGHCMP